MGKRLFTVSCEHLNSNRVQAQVPPANFRPSMSATAPTKLIRVVWIVVALIAGLAGAVAALTQVYGDTWKQQGVALLNDQIKGEFVVQDVELSWWNGFPNISVDLWEASLTLPVSSETLLSATRIGVEMDVWTLWNNRSVLSSLTWSGGHLKVVEAADGSWNVSSVLNSNPEDSTAELRLDRVLVKDVHVEAVFRDGQRWKGRLREVNASQQGRGNWSWDVRASKVQLPHHDAPELHPLEIEAEGQLTWTDDTGWMSRGTGSLSGLGIVWNASQRPNQPPEIDVASTLTQPKLEGILVEIPWRDMGSFGHAVQVDATFRNGVWQASWNARQAEFQLAPAFTGLTMALQGECDGHGTLRQTKNGLAWEVTEGTVQGPGWKLAGSASPHGSGGATFQGTGDLDMSTPLLAWWPEVPSWVTSAWPATGAAYAEGAVRWAPGMVLPELEGVASLETWMGTFEGTPYQLSCPEIQAKKGLLTAETVEVQWAGNDATIGFRIFDVVQALRGGAVEGELDIAARALHADPWVQWLGSGEPSTEAVLLPPGSELAVSLASGQLLWSTLECTDVRTQAKVQHDRCTLLSVSLRGLEGEAQVEGSLKPGRAGWALTLRGAAEDVSLPLLFETYGNFDQTLLRHEHLSGAVSLAGNLGMSWTLDGTWRPDEFTASVETFIDHGGLLGLEVFDDVADYLDAHRLMAPLVDPDDLRSRLANVAFNPVSQRLDVSQNVVRLPKTTIQSSAMNVSIEGDYHFDEVMDYTLGFALRDLRASASDNVGVMEDDGLGKQFFLNMSGPLDAPVYKYDREAAKEHRRNAIDEEKTRLLNALKGGPDVSEGEPSTPAQEIKPEERGPLLGRKNRGDRRNQNKQDNLLNPDDEDYL